MGGGANAVFRFRYITSKIRPFVFTVSRSKLLKLQWHVIQVTRRINTLIQCFDQLQATVVEGYCEVCDDASTPNKKQTNKQTKKQ